MKMTIGLAEAKARLSEVVEQVESGDVIVISRRGKPVVEMRPCKPVSTRETIKKIRAMARRLSKRNAEKEKWPPDGRSLRDIAHEGHRY